MLKSAGWVASVLGGRENHRLTHVSFVVACLDRSSIPFTQYAMLLCNGFGDVDKGCRYAELGLKMKVRYEAREWTARTFCGAYGFCLVWKRQLGDLLLPLLEAHDTGLATGDIEVGVRQENDENANKFRSLNQYVVLFLFSFRPCAPTCMR